jgi:hypothetical protein
MLLRFTSELKKFARENNLECDFEFTKDTGSDSVNCIFINPVTEKHMAYIVAIADEEDLDGTIDIIKEDIEEELISNDEENSLVSDSKEA